ncbi:MAG TPA: ion channel [Sedimentisphaerales bacterium]|nr:ion channel [Sedimentisphaerales bacterium]HRS09653.1 ion channel [Sedimentisphaerales bacterium]HRV46334.1 ion channel [Sedimentisphaerales bacterium]
MARPDEGENQRQPRFSQGQYDMLKRCSDRQDMTEWNDWRRQHPEQDVLLENITLQNGFMRGAMLGAFPNSGFSGKVHLEGVKLHGTYLEQADLSCSHLEHSKLIAAFLGGADLRYACLQDADFSRFVVDGTTLLYRCEVNRNTKFEGVALAVTRIYPDTSQLLEYNIRRMNWEQWYKEHRCLRWPVRLFWLASDYGLSTWRVIVSFGLLASVFVIVYRLWPGCLAVDGEAGDIRGFVHALYFSVVTMTTLGFGDIAANPDSTCGQVLLMLQVILGYVLLGALVTRFAVLFTAGGPASPMRKGSWSACADG